MSQKKRLLIPRLILALSFLVWLVLFFILSGCASVKQKLNPEVYYERSLRVEYKHNKEWYRFTGVGVLPLKNKYELKISNPSRGRLDFVKFHTCHQEHTFNSEGSKMEFSFWTGDIEQSGNCLVKIDSYDKDGEHGWAVLETRTSDATLPATLYCNGYKYQDTVTICQSRHGLIQKIEFKEPVRLSMLVDDKCKIAAPNKFTSLEFQIKSRVCVYAFATDDNKIHRLTTIGYEGVLVPGGE